MSGLLIPPTSRSTNVMPPGSFPRSSPERPLESVGLPRIPHVPGYAVLDELGRGGMGIVFRARDQKLNRIVALKMMLTGEFTGTREAERFHAEADAIARIQHPHIVQVYEVGNSFGRPFMAMEFVPGGSLAGKSARRQQPIEASAELVELIARALHAAHRQGVLHRDLKPSNVLLAPPAPGQEHRSAPHALRWFGIPKVTDFGLAKELDPTSAATQSRTLMGTPSYMAPEQTVPTAAGGSQLGPATDVYGLGAILYELLTGRPPFDSSNPMDTIVQVRTVEPIAPSYWQPRLPKDLQTVCLKCLHKDPRQRYASAESLADDLRRFLDGTPVLAKPASSADKAVKWAKRRPAVAGLLAACLLIAILGVAGIVVQWRHAEAARENAVEAGNRLREQLDLSARSLYVSRLNNSRLNWINNNAAGAALELFGAARELRGFEWHILHRQQTAELWSVALPDCVQRTRFSPDARIIYVAVGDPTGFPWSDAYAKPGQVIAWDLTAESPLWVNTDVRSSVRHVTVAPDGSTLFATGIAEQAALIDERTGATISRFEIVTGPAGYHPIQPILMVPSRTRVLFIDARTGKEVSRWQNLKSTIVSAAYSPDGRAAVLRTHRSELCIHDARNGGLLQSFPTGSHSTISPDGRHVASIGPGPQIAIERLPPHWSDPDISTRPSPSLHCRCQGHDGPIHCLEFSPDGLEIAAGGRDGTVRTWSVSTGLPSAVWRGQPSGVSDVGWSRCGQYLLAGSEYAATVKIWDTSREPEQCRIGVLPYGLFNTEALAFTSDGQSILGVALTGDLLRWDVATGAERLIARLPIMNDWSTPTRRAAIHADSQRLAAVDRDLHTVCVFRTTDGGEVRVFPGHTRPVNAMRFSPDGHWLATAAYGPDANKSRWSEVILWDLENGTPHQRWDGFAIDVCSLAFNSDATRLAVGGRENKVTRPNKLRKPVVRLLNLPDGEWQDIPGLVSAESPDDNMLGPVVALEFHPKRDELAVSFHGDPTIMIWDWPGEEPPHRQLKMDLPAHAYALAYSNDGQRLIGACRDGVRIWDERTGQEILMLRGAHQAPGDPGVNPQLALSPHGDALAAANWDGSISCWSAAPFSDGQRIHERVAARGRTAAFRLKRAERCADERLPEQAIVHLNAIRSELTEETARSRAFQVACRVGDFSDALLFWRQLHRQKLAVDWIGWSEAAPIVLHVLGPAAYFDHCREMTQATPLPGDGPTAARVIEACALQPGALDTTELVDHCVRLVHAADAGDQPAALGMAYNQLRAGRFDAAIATAQTALDSSAMELSSVGRSARAAALMAVAQAAAHRPAEAKAAINQSRSFLEQLDAAHLGFHHWHDRLVAGILLQEAESSLSTDK